MNIMRAALHGGGDIHRTEAAMPMITLQYACLHPQPDLAETLAKTVSALSAELLHKDPLVTAVAVEEIAASRWFIADRSLERHGLASFWIDIRIVEGTNTREEKSAFIAACFARMGALLGPLHRESYVHVDEVRGDAYGYGGVTQNERYMAGRLKQSGALAA
jgi:4-oxalocrotonate tautomerase